MPSSIVYQSYLEKNLACLGKLNADVIRLIRETEPTSDISFEETPQGVPTAIYKKKLLASKHRPLDEAEKIAERVDIVANAVVVVYGYGLGYHVQKIAEQMERTGVIIVLEPDVALLKTVFERIDFSKWLSNALVILLTDPNDHVALTTKMKGAECIISQGVSFVEHPASRERLAEASNIFSGHLSQYIGTTKTMLMTTLIRATDTIQNLLWNIDHYTLGGGILELKNVAKNYPAVVVSAGPSLKRNMHLLAQPGVRDRCVIIAVQTTLIPLLDAGIKPHFVTALDYHEISKRFYEGLTESDVENVTLIADPKAHPIIIDSFPGKVRCCSASFLDKLLGDYKRDMGYIPPGATVANLAFYLAQFLGCNPIVFIGQDLGFTDGLYYSPGTSIHDIWAPELNPFNTIETMEWQRIVRHRVHLQSARDIFGRSIFTDAQMLAYLKQFERDFAAAEEEGTTIIDATEGGICKQHTKVRSLQSVLDEYLNDTLPEFSEGTDEVDSNHQFAVRERINKVRIDLVKLALLSKKTTKLIEKMLDSQEDKALMDRCFDKIEKNRIEVEKIFEVFDILNNLNQLGVYRRQRNDRRIHLSRNLDALERQRAQLERDLDNVKWIADAAEELIQMLAIADNTLSKPGEHWMRPPKEGLTKVKEQQIGTVEDSAYLTPVDDNKEQKRKPCISAIIAVDPQRNGIGIERSLLEDFNGRSVLQATLEHIAKCKMIDSIILIAQTGFDIEPLIDTSKLAVPVIIEKTEEPLYGPEREAIAAARLFADTCWRGGIGGLSIYDEIVYAGSVSEVMKRRGIDAAIITGPDWPLVDISEETGIDALVRRYLEYPGKHGFVFTQAPPGLSACLISKSVMKEMASRNRLSTTGGILGYLPHAPQADPIAKDANVHIKHDVLKSQIRATFDNQRWREMIQRAGIENLQQKNMVETVKALEQEFQQTVTSPQHLIIELNTKRSSSGIISRRMACDKNRTDIDPALVNTVFDQLKDVKDCVVTFAGAGDPLLHPEFDHIITYAKESGVKAVHMRTELRCDNPTIDRMLAAGVDVVSIELHADRQATYQVMMGDDLFKHVLINMEYLGDNRRKLTSHNQNIAYALPWIVPRILRCRETYEDLNSFYDRWMSIFGWAVIEGDPSFTGESSETSTELDVPALLHEIESGTQPPFSTTYPPSHVYQRELRRRMVIHSDGSVPVSELDLNGTNIAGNISNTDLKEVWDNLLEARSKISDESGEDAELLRTFQP